MKNAIKVAICYDFDGTLAPGNMQEYGFMKALGISPSDFWYQSDTMSSLYSADKNLCYMFVMLKEAKKRGISLTKDNLKKFGMDVKFFKGVETWFERINDYGRQFGIEVQHYLLSSGITEIVEGLPICKYFTKVYANSFLYDENGEANWPAQIVNYTTKTQFLFRISKGCLDENDTSVNDRTTERNIPFKNMLYIGDGLTDIPCMAILKKFGGSGLAVYNNSDTNAKKLLEEGRADNIALADYSENSKVEHFVKALILKVKGEAEMRA